MKNYKRESWPLASHHLKINSKWNIDLNVKILEENLRGNLSDIRVGKDFLNMTQKA